MNLVEKLAETKVDSYWLYRDLLLDRWAKGEGYELMSGTETLYLSVPLFSQSPNYLCFDFSKYIKGNHVELLEIKSNPREIIMFAGQNYSDFDDFINYMEFRYKFTDKMVDYLGWKIDKIMNYEYILRKLTEYKDKYR